MPKKTKIIFITTFIIVGLILIFITFSIFKNKKDQNTNEPIQNQTFNPFGEGEQNKNNGSEEYTNQNIEWTNLSSEQKSRFSQITDFAVAGAGFYEEIKLLSDNNENPPVSETTTPVANKTTKTIPPKTVAPKTETIPSLRYVDRVTGHIYQMSLDTKEVSEISNSTIPGVYEVLMDKLANTFIYRYLATDNKSITSYMATLGETKGEFLPSNIIEIALSGDKTKAFYLVKNSNGVVGFTLLFEGNKKSQVFVSSFSEWQADWVTENKIFLTTRPSWSVSGSLFSLDIINGTLTKIFGVIYGLTTLANNDGTQVLYGASLETGPKLWLLNIKDHTTKDLDTYGLPEKCIWSSDNISVYCAVPNTIKGTQYPDSWYQGLVSFDDYFVKINTQTATRSTLANSKNEIPVDATKLFLDKEENNLFFINKKDSTLWSLDL